MEFVDTNYFLRYLLKDNEKQYQIARNLFEAAILGKTQLFTSTVVFFEIYWVLSTFYNPIRINRLYRIRRYKQNKEEFLSILSDILKMNYIELEERELLIEVLEINKNSNLSLEDCYNLVYSQDNKALFFATFDKKLSQKFKSLNK